nr:reverse transcriptase domain-containing protein [Tanacetum cinerariifolium]
MVVRHWISRSRWTIHYARGPICICSSRFSGPTLTRLPTADSPTVDSPGCILESGPKEDPEEDEEDPDKDPADYPTDRDDDDDDEEEEESSRDEADNVEEDEDEDEKEEEHPALADSIPPSPVYRVTARMSIREQPHTPVCSEVEIDRLLAIPSPPPSPLSPWSSPLPQIPSPPLSVSSPLPISSPPLPASPTYPLRYRAAMIRLRAETPSTSHTLSSSTPPSGTPPLLPIPLPTSSPPLLLPSTSHRADVLEVTLPPWNRLCIALRMRYEVGKSSSAAAARPTRGFRADYSFVATLDDEIRRDPERELSYGITNTWDEMLDDRALISEQVNMLYRDRRDHARTAKLMKAEARLSRQAWVQSMDASDLVRFEVMALRTQRGPVRGPAQSKAPEEAGGVANALASRDADRSRNSEDSHESKMGVRRQSPPTRECTYQDFMKCKPLYFKGTEGVVELTQWFERMETMFCISNCTVENQIKFAICTLLGSALTWWNSHVTTVGLDVAYAMTWTNLRKKMTDKYCPRGKIKKLEGELLNLRVKSNDVVGYNQCFQELALLCVRMFPKESDKVERYVDGLPDVIHESVVGSRIRQ